jgi:hypothetical protein
MYLQFEFLYLMLARPITVKIKPYEISEGDIPEVQEIFLLTNVKLQKFTLKIYNVP